MIFRLALVEARKDACTNGPRPAPTTITTVTFPFSASASDTCQIRRITTRHPTTSVVPSNGPHKLLAKLSNYERRYNLTVQAPRIGLACQTPV